MQYGRGMSERWTPEDWCTAKAMLAGALVLIFLWVAMSGAGWN